jgi:hypothetical protein
VRSKRVMPGRSPIMAFAFACNATAWRPCSGAMARTEGDGATNDKVLGTLVSAAGASGDGELPDMLA